MEDVMAPPPGDRMPTYVGYIACLLAAVFFGSNFIPVKKFETGDGLFFQLVLCIAIWIPSVVLHAIRGFPRFWPLAMLGGFIWCTGNIMVVPIIQCIGMAMGILIWSMTNLLFGWASGRFGWFGLDAEVPHNTTLNYIGVVLCCCSAIIVSLIKPHVEEPDNHSDPHEQFVNETEPLLSPISGDPPLGAAVSYTGSSSTHKSVQDDEAVDDKHGDLNSFHHRLSPRRRRIVGIVLSLISGAFYGINFAPVIYIKDNYGQWFQNCTADPCLEKVSGSDIDYVFAHFTGILLTSILYFTIYCIVKRNRPNIYPKIILPALASGVMWSIADISFFIANEALDESVSFPIINAGPGLVASIYGVFLFKEIQGRRNLMILALAFCFTAGGCTLTALSK